jgi:iron only hydrogenase large subunit-like protein
MEQINCKEACINGCVLGNKCPNLEHRDAASKFIEDTSLDKMIEMAEIARMKKLSEPPKWIIPDEI